jgi:hypothetical protein
MDRRRRESKMATVREVSPAMRQWAGTVYGAKGEGGRDGREQYLSTVSKTACEPCAR